jgi:hypothetical protein
MLNLYQSSKKILNSNLKNLISILIYLFLPFLLSCQISDLRNEQLSGEIISEDIQTKGRSLLVDPIDPALTPSKWQLEGGLEIFLIDYWKSSLVRFFTPIPEPVQAMKVKIYFQSKNMEITFTDGKNRGKILGIENGETYTIDKDLGKVFNKDNEVKLYLESLRLYILLPILASRMEKLAYLGEVGMGEKSYSEVFGTNGNWTPEKESDQYRFLIQNDSGRIEFIVFTYREVFESYKGILHYQDYTLLNGRLFPMRISVKSEFSDESYIHQLQIGTLKSIPSPSFQRNINIP